MKGTAGLRRRRGTSKRERSRTVSETLPWSKNGGNRENLPGSERRSKRRRSRRRKRVKIRGTTRARASRSASAELTRVDGRWGKTANTVEVGDRKEKRGGEEKTAMRSKSKDDITRLAATVMETESTTSISKRGGGWHIRKPGESAEAAAALSASDAVGRQDGGGQGRSVKCLNHGKTKGVRKTRHTKIAHAFRVMRAVVSNTKSWDIGLVGEEGNMPEQGDVGSSVRHRTTIHVSASGSGKLNAGITRRQIGIERRTRLSGLTEKGFQSM
jgi:hypothetical protein